ncbi:glucosidase family protein [Paenibacillus roseipurpureus]|uniref:Uncharacterized protein n=1 Tax=Paenibacillus roseopurpureus TaxID=2918901 RepID=A0AA96LT60_9BACL|nr:hypothetical protein [Paenibacillus sp. MBLB1832]WNR46814.1 hypothetical protein MJB10_12195 [Paenibacillus sp. MBLB1832]
MSILKNLLEQHPEWIQPRSDQHTVLAVPNTRDHRKTFAEPGGSFSPGVASFGITLWIYDHQNKELLAPELYAAEGLDWNWYEGYVPLLQSTWLAGDCLVQQELFSTSLKDLHNIVNSWRTTLTNHGTKLQTVTVYAVIRPYGPAGGRIHDLVGRESSISVNGKTVLLAKTKAHMFGALSYEYDGMEISSMLKQGLFPSNSRAKDRDGLCSGALAYELQLLPGETAELEFDLYVHPLEKEYMLAFEAYHQQDYMSKRTKFVNNWKKLLHKVKLQLPNQAFAAAYYSTLAQMLMATVDHQPRIATITYPLLWIRDGVYITVSLDQAGFHEEARKQLDILKDRIFAGGFGAEPDAFGEAIWPFHRHYQLTGDVSWLSDVYPYVKKRADWIIKCVHTEQYLYADTDMRVPGDRHAPDNDLIVEPAREGLMIGRMDGHRPLIWVNAFSFMGLNAASEIAAKLGYEQEAELYASEALKLNKALTSYANKEFGRNERDLVCAIWPSRTFSPNDPHIRSEYEQWWNTMRQKDGNYRAEPMWKYFELGQAHNYLLLGEREKVNQTVDHYLANHDVEGLYGWLEDNHDIAEFWSKIEGWYRLPSRQPHGWVSAELHMLLRDMLLYESEDRLIIGAGIPKDWFALDARIAFEHMPTSFGYVDVSIEGVHHGQFELHVTFHELERLPSALDIRLPLTTAESLTIFKDRYTLTGSITIPLGG